jgi:hypothetical protein
LNFLLRGLFWFVFSAANMAGSLSDLADAEAQRETNLAPRLATPKSSSQFQ